MPTPRNDGVLTVSMAVIFLTMFFAGWYGGYTFAKSMHATKHCVCQQVKEKGK